MNEEYQLSDRLAQLNDLCDHIASLESKIKALNAKFETARANSDAWAATAQHYHQEAEKIKAERDPLLIWMGTIMQIPEMTNAQLEELRTNCAQLLTQKENNDENTKS
jgi:uncharacterized coiled-coil DUF342 family protein